MKVTIKYIGIVIVAALILGSAIVFIFRKQIASHYIPEVNQIGIFHVKLKNDTSYVNFDLTVTNKSFFNIRIDTVTYKISLFNKTYLQRQRFLGVELPGYGSDTIQMSLKIPYAAILKNLNDERKKGDSTSYSIQLYLQCITFLGQTEISINRAATLKIPEVPELEIAKINWMRVRLKSILATVDIKLINHSKITLAIKDLRYTMDIADHGHLTGVYPEPIIIKPNGETVVTFPVDIVVHHMGKTIFEVMANTDNYDYTLTLDAVLESTDSLKNKIHIELIKDGRLELKK